MLGCAGQGTLKPTVNIGSDPAWHCVLRRNYAAPACGR